MGHGRQCLPGRIRWLRGTGEGECGDVIFLAEQFRSFGDLVGGLAGDCGGAIEAKEHACLVARLDYAVAEQGELLAWGELEDGLGIGGLRSQTEREAVFKGEFIAGQVW